MSAVTADAAMQTQLGKLNEHTEIRDDKGNLLAYFTPASVVVVDRRVEVFQVSRLCS